MCLSLGPILDTLGTYFPCLWKRSDVEDSERRDTVRPHASRAVSLVLAVKRDILVATSGARCPILYSFAKTLLDISYRYTQITNSKTNPRSLGLAHC
jgi:hypothetical protein